MQEQAIIPFANANPLVRYEKYRVCFTWVGDAAYGVEIVDYHH